MLQLTKIFHFEMAHAIYGYSGACRYIHGHSYELHVTISTPGATGDSFIPVPGFILDFKELKKLVKESVIEKLDHKLILSQCYLSGNPALRSQQNLIEWEPEPTAENLLIYIRKELEKKLPLNIKLINLRIYETKDSYAEWSFNAI